MESLRDQLTPLKGTYALALLLAKPRQIIVGALGAHIFPAAHYIYIGSAWGSGGIRARLTRHIHGSPEVHWHIDYLRQVAQPVGYWLAEGQRLECTWSAYLAEQPQSLRIVPGFGASDCSCSTHLYALTEFEFNKLILPEDSHFHRL